MVHAWIEVVLKLILFKIKVPKTMACIHLQTISRLVFQEVEKLGMEYRTVYDNDTRMSKSEQVNFGHLPFLCFPLPLLFPFYLTETQSWDLTSTD